MSVGGTQTLPPILGDLLRISVAVVHRNIRHPVRLDIAHSAVICNMPATCCSPFLKMVYVIGPNG